jgi:hypothetical protein
VTSSLLESAWDIAAGQGNEECLRSLDPYYGTEVLRHLILCLYSAKLAQLNPANYTQACIGVLVAVNVTHSTTTEVLRLLVHLLIEADAVAGMHILAVK